MYFLVAAANYYLGTSVMAFDVQEEEIYITPDRWLEAEDIGYHSHMRSHFLNQRVYQNAMRMWGIFPVPDTFSRNFAEFCAVEKQLRFLLGRGMFTLVTSPLRRSRQPDDGVPKPFPALPSNSRLQLYSDATRDLTPGTVSHLGMILGLLATSGSANYTIGYEWVGSEEALAAELETVVLALSLPEIRKFGSRCPQGEELNSFNHLRWEKGQCISSEGSSCLHLYATGNLTFLLQVSEVVMGAERTELYFPGWPRHPLQLSRLPTSLTLLRHDVFQGFNAGSVCINPKTQAFGKKYFTTPSPTLKLDCSVLGWKGPPVHTVSDWFVVQYEDLEVTYEYSPHVEGGLRPKAAHQQDLMEVDTLIKDASLIMRRCRFNHTESEPETIRCAFYLWYWRSDALRRHEFADFVSKRERSRVLFHSSLQQSFPSSRRRILRMLPSCGHGHWYSHCELPQAPYEAGPLVGLYTDETPMSLSKEQLLRFPPFSAPQLVTWAFRPLEGPAEKFSEEMRPKEKSNRSHMKAEMKHLCTTSWHRRK